ncbi:MAG: hypothetical protein CO094_03105 [Anaerolineae bacterium CG_4_9_14_3_um_filter_57_17]|nr:hypothetical protein [bacterium]NCT21572.1 hypothetical protein [bacterium]OIO87271.1 MAG: hypothetical protein AUK01_00845 [Anaerolineae bacterium CG2_30_57_67]PJB67753.1 MAG: hypothetical protein CO094_03105 [Anaerolineae bacterium CG_4_9_14_3_um_filter_57_17]
MIWILLLFILWLAAVIFFRVYRIWLPYYALAAIGSAYWLVAFANTFLFQDLLAQLVAFSVSQFAGFLGIATQIFKNAPGLLMVLVITQNVGWTVLQIGVESSGMLESIVVVSLVMFYPGWSWGRRIFSVLAGLFMTWGANILRLMIIVVLLHWLGKPVLVIAHTFLAKAAFFGMTVAIYWFLITRPTIYQVAGLLRRQSLEKR